MSLRQMEYLVTVVEESSFTRAAETLHVTQSALSHQIKALERDVGGPLLERLPRGVRLTQMGRAFLPTARSAIPRAIRSRSSSSVTYSRSRSVTSGCSRRIRATASRWAYCRVPWPGCGGCTPK